MTKTSSPVSSITFVARKRHKPLTPTKLIIVVAALAVLIFSATLSGTIVSTATRSISKDLGHDNITWVAQAFLILCTALQPAWGKFSDIFGRRIPMIMGIVLLAIFSGLAGASVNMMMLIIARAIMGIGASSSLAMVNIILADIVPIRKRGKYMGFISAANGVGQVIGPLLGGLISDTLGWRWTQFINIPLLIVAAVPLIMFVWLPTPGGTVLQKLGKVDWKGVACLVLATVLLLLGVDFGGTDNSWGKPRAYTLMLAGILLFVGFCFIELKTSKDPIISMQLMRYRNVWINLVGALITGSVMYVGIFYIPVFFTAVYEATATKAGTLTWPWMVCVIISSVGCGIAITKYGIYRPYLWIGSILLSVGFGLMYTLKPEQNFTKQAIYISIVGLGIGFRLPPATISAQAVVTKEELASTTALVNFARSMGGILGLSISKAIQSSSFTSKASNLSQLHPEYSHIISEVAKGKPLEIWKIQDEIIRDSVLKDFVDSIKIVFLICSIIAIIGLVFSFYIIHDDSEYY
ncbi:hypothetical protein BB559_007189 [Furculomyces boomerangus]|uniref:Major facilitator superfamily (MFS) profile domain-containing protein n=1 Tax=Furculomyces boomerangus TaxID=61424 RepID=A0A2T9XYG1_9FUNG|nr:hypothetical protein BB559_007189 [Furculomyces boomerangus]